jgi:hypothetical protein
LALGQRRRDPKSRRRRPVDLAPRRREAHAHDRQIDLVHDAAYRTHDLEVTERHRRVDPDEGRMVRIMWAESIERLPYMLVPTGVDRRDEAASSGLRQPLRFFVGDGGAEPQIRQPDAHFFEQFQG